MEHHHGVEPCVSFDKRFADVSISRIGRDAYKMEPTNGIEPFPRIYEIHILPLK